MRLVAGILLVAACGGRPSSADPAWPKSAGHVSPDSWEEDGGESIAPRVTRDVAAVEKADEPEPETEPETTVEVAPEAPPADAPVPPPEEPPTVEIAPEDAIIIEGEAPPEP